MDENLHVRNILKAIKKVVEGKKEENYVSKKDLIKGFEKLISCFELVNEKVIRIENLSFQEIKVSEEDETEINLEREESINSIKLIEEKEESLAKKEKIEQVIHQKSAPETVNDEAFEHEMNEISSSADEEKIISEHERILKKYDNELQGIESRLIENDERMKERDKENNELVYKLREISKDIISLKKVQEDKVVQTKDMDTTKVVEIDSSLKEVIHKIKQSVEYLLRQDEQYRIQKEDFVLSYKDEDKVQPKSVLTENFEIDEILQRIEKLEKSNIESTRKFESVKVVEESYMIEINTLQEKMTMFDKILADSETNIKDKNNQQINTISTLQEKTDSLYNKIHEIEKLFLEIRENSKINELKKEIFNLITRIGVLETEKKKFKSIKERETEFSCRDLRHIKPVSAFLCRECKEKTISLPASRRVQTSPLRQRRKRYNLKPLHVSIARSLDLDFDKPRGQNTKKVDNEQHGRSIRSRSLLEYGNYNGLSITSQDEEFAESLISGSRNHVEGKIIDEIHQAKENTFSKYFVQVPLKNYNYQEKHS
eukprot:augustus_masked-scaffold_21-processed-gene-3.5-mRNA-1 protein AED:1.00 eAED:1.00 QI:0/-1/0/0/-1/1/1/0/543